MRKSNQERSRLNYVQVDWVEVAYPDVGPANRAFGLDVQGGGNALKENEYQNKTRDYKQEGHTSRQKTCPHRVVVSVSAESRHSGQVIASDGLEV